MLKDYWPAYGRYIVISALSFLLGAAIFAGAMSSFQWPLPNQANQAQAQETAAPAAVTAIPAGAELVGPSTIADTVEKVGPAVVKIDTVVETSAGSSFDPFDGDPFFRQFFGDSFQTPQMPREQQGMGSGFIMSKDGYILTNEHVIGSAKEIKVTVSGYDEPFKAEVAGADYELDLAILKIEAPQDLPFLKLGNSDGLKVGEWAIAIGNPYGLDHTVTVGVIGAKGRPVTVEDRRYKNLIQTDAAINPGNSGGPLLNLQGEVIGINTAVNKAAQGIGFAIPINTAKEVMDDLINQGKVFRPWLGVYVQPVTQELAEYFGLPGAKGALISYVLPDSPAQKAGLQNGDVILKVGQKEISDSLGLGDEIKNLEIGEKAVLLVYRDQHTIYVPIVIGEQPGKNGSEKQ